MAIICPYVCLVTVLLQGARGLLLMTTWPKNCGRSAATCLASPGNESWQLNCTVKDMLFHRGIDVAVTDLKNMLYSMTPRTGQSKRHWITTKGSFIF